MIRNFLRRFSSTVLRRSRSEQASFTDSTEVRTGTLAGAAVRVELLIALFALDEAVAFELFGSLPIAGGVLLRLAGGVPVRNEFSSAAILSTRSLSGCRRRISINFTRPTSS